MKRKFMTIALATCLVLGMSTSVFAAYTPGSTNNITGDTIMSNDSTGSDNIADKNAGISVDPGSASKDIPLKVEINNTPESNTYTDVIAVDVDTTEVTFKYTPAGKKMIWDPVQLKYVMKEDNKGKGTWDYNGSQEIKVTSYSSVGIDVNATVSNNGITTNNVKFTLTNDKFKLDSAATVKDETTTGTAKTGTITVNAAVNNADKDPSAITNGATLKIEINPSV